MQRIVLLLILGMLHRIAVAQEFPKGFSLPVELGQGFNQPAGTPLYLLTLQAVPQVTIVPERLRLAAVLGGFYPATSVGVLAGPRVTLKVLEGKPILSASSFNLHVLAEFLWATAPELTKGRQLLGGGIGIGSSDLATVSLKLHRDLVHSATWFQVSVGYNLVRKTPPPL
ncbi:hypothetical protein GCM10027341_15020 [Spirosoma knui]